MKKITLFILLLSISSSKAQTIVRKNGLGKETTGMNAYSNSSFFSGESIVVVMAGSTTMFCKSLI